jgi:hypothetical protein
MVRKFRVKIRVCFKELKKTGTFNSPSSMWIFFLISHFIKMGEDNKKPP